MIDHAWASRSALTPAHPVSASYRRSSDCQASVMTSGSAFTSSGQDTGCRPSASGPGRTPPGRRETALGVRAEGQRGARLQHRFRFPQQPVPDVLALHLLQLRRQRAGSAGPARGNFEVRSHAHNVLSIVGCQGAEASAASSCSPVKWRSPARTNTAGSPVRTAHRRVPEACLDRGRVRGQFARPAFPRGPAAFRPRRSGDHRTARTAALSGQDPPAGDAC